MIYLPELGMVPDGTVRVVNELRNYDERLYLKRNPDSGEWCVYVKQEYGSILDDMPVLGLGAEIPTDWYFVLAKIQSMDTLRYAKDLLTDMNKSNARRQQAALNQRNDAVMEAAEHMEYALRREGNSPVIKSVRYRRRW